MTVTADRLVAWYRPKAGATPPAASAPARPPGAAPGTVGEEEGGGNEIYRLEAEGHVQISTPTDHASCDRAVYDLDQAVLVMTGHDLRLVTPNEVLTAHKDMEYWSAKHMAVARGDAVVVTRDARRISADVLVAYTSPAPAPGAAPAATPAAAPGKPPARARTMRSPRPASCAGWRRSAMSCCAPRPTSSPATAPSMFPPPARRGWKAMCGSPAARTSSPARRRMWI